MKTGVFANLRLLFASLRVDERRISSTRYDRSCSKLLIARSNTVQVDVSARMNGNTADSGGNEAPDRARRTRPRLKKAQERLDREVGRVIRTTIPKNILMLTPGFLFLSK